MDKMYKILTDNIFIGVVEDNIDPDKKQRVKIRIPYLHGDVTEIKTEDLPWVHPIKYNSTTFKIPDKNKIVNVRFPTGDLMYSVYESVEHLNVNLQKKIEKLSDKDYTEFIALCYNHNTQIFIDENDGLNIQHKYQNINLLDNEISLNLKDNNSNLYLGHKTAAQEAVLGTNFFAWFDSFLAQMPGFYIAVAPGSPCVPSPTLIAALAQYNSLKKTFKSMHVKIVDNMSVIKNTDKFDGQIGDKYDMTIDEAQLTAEEQELKVIKKDTTNKITKSETKDVESFVPDDNKNVKEELEGGLTTNDVTLADNTTVQTTDAQVGVTESEPPVDTTDLTESDYDDMGWNLNELDDMANAEQPDNSPANALEIYNNLKLETPIIESNSTPVPFNAADVLPNPATGNDLKDVIKMIRFLKIKNYNVYTTPYKMNIVGIRSKHKDNGTVTNKYDDYLWQFFKNDKDQWELYKFVVTTTPGFKPGTNQLHNGPSTNQGCAMMVYGQYVDAYSIGWHNSRDGVHKRKKNGQLYAAHPCLKNATVNVVRTAPGAKRYHTLNEIKEGKTKIMKAGGINIHRSKYKGEGNRVGDYSHGCQVFKIYSQFEVFMNNNYMQRDKGMKKFTYTLIPQQDFINFK